MRLKDRQTSLQTGPQHQKIVTGYYIADPYGYAKFGADPSMGVSGQMGEI